MKLIIQIPCYNEHDQLEATLSDLPRTINGIDEIEVIIIDDGSTDDTKTKAAACGAHYIVRFPRNRGLAMSYMAGLDACLRLGADIVVNTDADNQYHGADIARLVEPILCNRADIVIGNRQTSTISSFSPLKKMLQRWGSSVVRRASGTMVVDSTSGFRAMNRKTISKLFVHNRFSYTLETIIQAGNLALAIENINVRTNLNARPSRLFSSTIEYLRRNGLVILRAYTMYWPLRTFSYVALCLFLFGIILGLRFLYYYILDPSTSTHIQSLMVGVGSIVMAFVVGLMALLGDLMATNRRLNEETLARLRRLEAAVTNKLLLDEDEIPEGIEHTGMAPWRSGKNHQDKKPVV